MNATHVFVIVMQNLPKLLSRYFRGVKNLIVRSLAVKVLVDSDDVSVSRILGKKGIAH